MAPAAEKVRAALSAISIHTPRFPVIANTSAQPKQDAGAVLELLVQQVDSAVLWDRSIAFMAAQGVSQALELGPGKVLAGLVKRIAKDLKVLSLGTPEEIDSAPAFFG
jgi:[acyl-carrier-protein] S-malonyltransferase